jgi:L-fucose isomerase-like protein
MSACATLRHLAVTPAAHLVRPKARLQPIQASAGTPSVDLARVAADIADVATLAPTIVVENPQHWERVVRSLPADIDGILPLSIPAYPTEVWNSHPQALVERKLPVVFWCLPEYDEPDFWRWSARDMLESLGIAVHLVDSRRHGLALLRSLAVKRQLNGSTLAVFGVQNFPWNAHAAGAHMERALGIKVQVHDLDPIREHGARISDAEALEFWKARSPRYRENGVSKSGLMTAIKTWLAIRKVLVDTKALGFGVNCFGDLIPRGHREVPCLAQVLAREEGYLAACDGDFCCLSSMAVMTHLTGRTCTMSNLYPVSYVGALGSHFGDPLSPDPARFARSEWPNIGRLAHCGFAGVVSPEVAGGPVDLRDWGGTYEIKRDGRGCGVDGKMPPGPITAVEVKFDGKTLLAASGEVIETTEHPGMPHCEKSVLLRFRDLPGFVKNISREHPAIVYGDHIEDLKVAAPVLGMNLQVF